MNVFSLKTIKYIFKKYHFCPQKKWGQIFLTSPSVAKRMVEAANLRKEDVVLEIGAGLGALTFSLAKEAGRVIALEKDKKLFSFLEEEIKKRQIENVEVILADALNFFQDKNWLRKFKSKEIKIVANLPYQITGIFLRKVLEKFPEIKEMILMVQKEVGEKIIASSGKENILSLSVKFYAQVESLFSVSKNNFFPKPKVDSLVIRIRRKRKKISQEEEKKFFSLIKAAFSAKRRKLKNNLASFFKNKNWQKTLEKKGINLEQRAEELSLSDWLKLIK